MIWYYQMDHKLVRDSSPVKPDDMIGGENRRSLRDTGIAAPSNGKSYLLLPVGVPAKAEVATSGRNRVVKSLNKTKQPLAKGNTTQKRDKPVDAKPHNKESRPGKASGKQSKGKSPKTNKNVKKDVLATKISDGLNNYKMSTIYEKLISRPQYSAESIARANIWINKNINNIDPSLYFVCEKLCGDVDGRLCNCLVAGKVADVILSEDQISIEDPAVEVAVPQDMGVLHIRASWWARLIFNTRDSTYDPKNLINHDIGDIYDAKTHSQHHTIIPDKFALDWFSDLYTHLRANAFCTYPSRSIKLDHMHKLALKWLREEDKFSPCDMKPEQLAAFQSVIQKVTDELDSNLLYAETVPKTRRERFTRPWLEKSLGFPIAWIGGKHSMPRYQITNANVATSERKSKPIPQPETTEHLMSIFGEASRLSPYQESAGACWGGLSAVFRRLRRRISEVRARRSVGTVEQFDLCSLTPVN